MRFQITARYGRGSKRYHTFQVDAPEAAAALRLAADRFPEEIVTAVDLVELRVAPDPEKDRISL
ncbi:hypothetical protein ACFL3S_06215 [Gemmatimonadota bacterium]